MSAHTGSSWWDCAACSDYASHREHLYHPNSDVTPYDEECPMCHHLHDGADPDGKDCVVAVSGETDQREPGT